MGYAIVTGASGGIGLCIARELAAKKYDLLLVARSQEKLASIAKDLQGEFNVKANVLAVDLSEKKSVMEIKNWIDQNKVSVEILVNNAGYGLWGAFETSNLGGIDNMMRLNMNALVDLCYVAIPYLRMKTPSYILNVASTAAYQAVPTLSAYAATKAFVVLFTRGLRWELKGSGINVTCLSPGATSTGFIDRAGLTAMKERADKFSMAPQDVARIGINGMFKGRPEIVTGFVNWISVKLTYVMPKLLVEKIAASLYEK